MVHVVWIGSQASQVTAQPQGTYLLGARSRGIYLHTDSDWMLFLSYERYRGPLTLNLNHLPGSLREEPGDKVLIETGGLWFPKSDLWISTGGAEKWSAPLPTGGILPLYEMRARFKAVSQQIRAPNDLLDDNLSTRLSLALQNKQESKVAALLIPFLGRGSGLTPAGDDLVLGLLLALNRWGKVLSPGFAVETLNTQLIQEAFRRTTTLSANLIACAARGQADERLIAGLDGLVIGMMDVMQVAACFSGWGSTSGGSALKGIGKVLN